MPDEKYEKAVELAKEYYMKARKWSLIAAGAAFLLFAYFTFDAARFYAGSTVVEATVTGFASETSRSRSGVRSVSLRAQVVFENSNGAPQTAKLDIVNGFVFDADIGQQFQVRYNPEMPEFVWVNQFIPFWMRSIFTSGLVALALGFALLFAKKKPTNTIINYYLKRM